MTAAQVRSATIVMPSEAEVLVRLPDGELVPILRRSIQGKWLILETNAIDDAEGNQ